VSICLGSSPRTGSTRPGPGQGEDGTVPATMLDSARSRRWSPVSRASAQRAQARGREHAGVLVMPVTGGEGDDSLVGQLGVRARAASSVGGHQHPAGATGRASWPSHTRGGTVCLTRQLLVAECDIYDLAQTARAAAVLVPFRPDLGHGAGTVSLRGTGRVH
jgi:hypothetical protein